MLGFHMPFARKQDASSSDQSNDWLDDYLKDDDDEDDDDLDEEDEDDYPYIVVDFAEGLFDDDAESISADDAALIWMSNGKDEDYTFGYSEDELEGAV